MCKILLTRVCFKILTERIKDMWIGIAASAYPRGVFTLLI